MVFNNEKTYGNMKNEKNRMKNHHSFDDALPTLKDFFEVDDERDFMNSPTSRTKYVSTSDLSFFNDLSVTQMKNDEDKKSFDMCKNINESPSSNKITEKNISAPVDIVDG